MKLGIRARLVTLLVLVTLPLTAGSFISLQVIDDRLTSRIESDLANLGQLEAARISDALDDYERDAVSLASGPHVVQFVRDLHLFAIGDLPGGNIIGGIDQFGVIDPTVERPLAQLALALASNAATNGSEVVDLRLAALDGRVYGDSDGFEWVPRDPSLVDRAVTQRQVVFGNAYAAPSGEARLGMVAPIFDPTNGVVGALVLETRLDPITALVAEHETFGETTEAHLAQPALDGAAEFITELRFDRAAAFVKTVPAESGLPINQSLQSPEQWVLRANDYRNVDSILAVQTLEATGWGLVVKIDAAEAFAPISDVRRVIIAATVLAWLAAFLGATAVLNPLGRRLRRAARAAELVASGEHREPILDKSTDEIGAMSRSIDRLAADLRSDGAARAGVETRLRHQVTHDKLTGLRNRQWGSDAVEELFSTVSDHEQSSLLFADLDGFKDINDAYGHPVGDEVLVAVSSRLVGGLDDNASVVRWGGDEFIVILPGIDAAGARKVVADIRALLREPVSTTAGQHIVRCSLGQSTWKFGRSVEDCLSEADLAMLADKEVRTGSRSVPPATVRMVEEALKADEFVVWYQPIVNATTSSRPSLIGAEALVRLHTSEGLVLPVEFLPAIQESHLGAAVDRRVIASGIQQVAEWIEKDLVDDDFFVSFNLGPASLRDPDLAIFLSGQLALSPVGPTITVLELSENAERIAIDDLAELRKIGVRLAIDDVGTAHSNIDRLAELGAEVAKIDRRWVAGTDVTDASPNVLREIVEICRILGMSVIAEGVESREQFDQLRALGVEEFQGYLFGAAMDAATLEATFLAPTTVIGLA